MRIRQSKADAARIVKQFGLTKKRGLLLATINPSAFLLFLAKIAHGFAVAIFGIDNFKHRLVPLILDKKTTDTLPYLIGGDTQPIEPTHHTHIIKSAIAELNGIRYCLINIQLFAMLGSPRYVVIAGECLADESAFPKPS
jgi:hypothetical protein